MWLPVMAISFVCIISEARGECNKDPCGKVINKTYEQLEFSLFGNCTDVDLHDNSIISIKEEAVTNYACLKTLDLSNNELTQLPESFLSEATALEKINLKNNKLEKLPKSFFNHSANLQVVHLEGNRLSEIPSSIFHSGLRNLTVDCGCDLIANIMQSQDHISSIHSKPSVTCSLSSVFYTVEDFFQKECTTQGLLSLYIILAIAALVLIAGGVAFYLWKKKKNSAELGGKTAPDKSPSHGQPRYITKNMDAVITNESQDHRQDYENVFVGHIQTSKIKPYDYIEQQGRIETPSKQAVEEGIYLESDVNEGEQPIYSNTQGLYYNYSESGHSGMNKEEDDDVYILPDQ